MTGVVPFVVRRILVAIPVLLFITAGTFFLGRWAPGDPITVRTGGHASPEAVARIKQQLHLNDPIYLQYFHYMGDLLRGNLGTSQRRPGVPVADVVFPKMKISLEENVYPFILTFGLGMPIGVYLALKRGTWQDPAITTFLLLLTAIPVVLLIPALQLLLALKLKWLPVAGWHGLFSKTIILPTIILTIGGLAGIGRLMRISMLQVYDDEYVRTARAKGLAERVVIYRHVLRNAMLPIITSIVTALFFLFSGSFFVEILLGIPGIGAEAVSSINSRDYDEFMALTIFGAIAFILCNLFLDIIYTVIDPRIRLGET